MLKDLKEAYSKIDLEDKRNELNKEILSLLMMTDFQDDFYNYAKDSNISEDEFLTEIYMQIIFLRSELLTILKTSS